MAEEVPLLTVVRGWRPAIRGGLAVAAVTVVVVGQQATGWWREGQAARTRDAIRARNRTIVEETARRLGLRPTLLVAVAMAESSLNHDAKSPKGAIGLLQVMPATAAEVAAEQGILHWDLRNAKDNALIGGMYLKALLRRYRQDLSLALAAYHAGPGAVDGWVRQGRGLPGPEVVAAFGFDDTRAYVRRLAAVVADEGPGDEPSPLECRSGTLSRPP